MYSYGYQENLSTEKAEESSSPWLSRADVHSWRTGSRRQASSGGTKKTYRLMLPMVSPGFRLRKNTDIERVFRKGKPLFSLFLGCRFVAHPSVILAAFSVSKKQFPTAVLRNRLKRCLRESFRAHLKAELIAGGEYVFFCTKQVKNPSLQEIRDSMRAIFAKIR